MDLSVPLPGPPKSDCQHLHTKHLQLLSSSVHPPTSKSPVSQTITPQEHSQGQDSSWETQLSQTGNDRTVRGKSSPWQEADRDSTPGQSQGCMGQATHTPKPQEAHRRQSQAHASNHRTHTLSSPVRPSPNTDSCSTGQGKAEPRKAASSPQW